MFLKVEDKPFFSCVLLVLGMWIQGLDLQQPWGGNKRSWKKPRSLTMETSHQHCSADLQSIVTLERSKLLSLFSFSLVLFCFDLP